jgi:nitrous oxide reductase
MTDETSKSLGRRQFLGTLGATVAAAGGLGDGTPAASQ